ncbi:MAG: secretion system protein, partial [Halobacteriales archaeon]
ELRSFLTEKLRAAIKYETDEVLAQDDEDDEDVRANVIDQETRRLLKRFDLYADGGDGGSFLHGLAGMLGPLADRFGIGSEDGAEPTELEGIRARPEPVLIEEDSTLLSEYQVEKLLYYLKRDFVGYERIDGIKHDI